MDKGILLSSVIIFCIGTGVSFAADNKNEAKKSRFDKPDQSELRCWQQGKLLFSEPNWHSFTIANKENVLNFTHEAAVNQRLSLINMGDTICLYKKQE